MGKNGKVVVMVRGEEDEEREEEIDKEEKGGSRSRVHGAPFPPVSLPLVLMTRGCGNDKGKHRKINKYQGPPVPCVPRKTARGFLGPTGQKEKPMVSGS